MPGQLKRERVPAGVPFGTGVEEVREKEPANTLHVVQRATGATAEVPSQGSTARDSTRGGLQHSVERGVHVKVFVLALQRDPALVESSAGRSDHDPPARRGQLFASHLIAARQPRSQETLEHSEVPGGNQRPQRLGGGEVGETLIDSRKRSRALEQVDQVWERDLWLDDDVQRSHSDHTDGV